MAPPGMLMTPLPPPPLHLPFEAGAFRLALGLTAAPHSEWLEIDRTYPSQMAERARLLAERPDAVLGLGEAGAAARRGLLDRLAAHLPSRYPDWFVRDGAVLENRLLGERWHLGDHQGQDPLVVVGRLVQEDFCLLRLAEQGPVLDSAVLCFPSGWRLAEKLGRPLLPIHAPVPFYADRLGRSVDRFMGALKSGRLAIRLNWSVTDDPALFRPTGHGRTGRNPDITAENAGASLLLRVERQSFRRLEPSGFVAFGIRIHLTPIAAIARQPGEAARLACAVRALPPEMARYKSIAPFREALLAYLDAAAHRPSRSAL